jgi:hypothetical protein
MGCGASKSQSPIQPLKAVAPPTQQQQPASVQKAPSSDEKRIPDQPVQKKVEKIPDQPVQKTAEISRLPPLPQNELSATSRTEIEPASLSSPAPIVESNSNQTGWTYKQ